MSENHLYNGSCEVVNAINLLRGRWKLPVLWNLSYGNIRYNELRRQVHGITNIMLTRSLQELEEHGLVVRIQCSEIPLHVEYGLTEAGRKLVPALLELKKWGEEQALFERQLHKQPDKKPDKQPEEEPGPSTDREHPAAWKGSAGVLGVSHPHTI